MTATATLVPSTAVLEARLAEVQGHFNTMAVLLDHSIDAVDRRDETIARLRAELDQVEAANQSLHSANARLIRENTTLRAEKREGLR